LAHILCAFLFNYYLFNRQLLTKKRRHKTFKMKTKLSFVFALLFASICSFAQTKPTVKTEKIKVWGNCEMCKAKIEKAAKSAGVSYALWNDEAKVLTVKYTAGKTSTDKIEKKVAAAGYDTQNETATEEAYNNLPGCCQYDRKAAEKKAETPKPASMK
jgi:mercuric ion binding protein